MHIQEQGGTGSTRFYGFSGTGGDRSMHLLSVKYRRSNPEESAATGRIRGGVTYFGSRIVTGGIGSRFRESNNMWWC